MNIKICLTVVATLGTLAIAAEKPKPPEQQTVQVRTSPVRDAASFLGRVAATASYGDAVEILASRPPWVQVRYGNTEGWMHQSSLSKKAVKMEAGTGDLQTSASAKEVSLAGKGFNKQVEKDFRSKNKDVDFTWIDRMETWRVSETEMRDYLKEGRVMPTEGTVAP